MFWVTSRNGLISTKSGIAKVTGKTLTSTAFLLLSVQVQMGSMFPQPNHKSHYGEKKNSQNESHNTSYNYWKWQKASRGKVG